MEFDIREFFKFLISKLGIIMISMILFIIIGAIYIGFVITPMYHSSTTLILVNNDTNQNTALLQSEVTLNKNLVYTYSEIVKSRTVLSKVIKRLDLDIDVVELSNNIKVSSVENTEIIKIEASSTSAIEAKQIAEETATVFKQEVQKIYNLTNVSVVDKAYLAKKPYNISPIKQTLIFAFLGFIMGTGIVFLIFYFDTSIKSSEDIEEKLGLAVIGNVALVSNQQKKKGDKGDE